MSTKKSPLMKIIIFLSIAIVVVMVGGGVLIIYTLSQNNISINSVMSKKLDPVDERTMYFLNAVLEDYFPPDFLKATTDDIEVRCIDMGGKYNELLIMRYDHDGISDPYMFWFSGNMETDDLKKRYDKTYDFTDYRQDIQEDDVYDRWIEYYKKEGNKKWEDKIIANKERKNEFLSVWNSADAYKNGVSLVADALALATPYMEEQEAKRKESVQEIYREWAAEDAAKESAKNLSNSYGDLSLVSSEWVLGKYSDSIKGKVKNNSGKTYKTVYVTYTLYYKGENVGQAIDSIHNLASGETGTFEANFTERIDDYKLSEIKGYE